MTKHGHIDLFAILLYTAIGITISATIMNIITWQVIVLISVCSILWAARDLLEEYLKSKERIIKKQTTFVLDDDPLFRTMKSKVHDLSRQVDPNAR